MHICIYVFWRIDVCRFKGEIHRGGVSSDVIAKTAAVKVLRAQPLSSRFSWHLSQLGSGQRTLLTGLKHRRGFSIFISLTTFDLRSERYVTTTTALAASGSTTSQRRRSLPDSFLVSHFCVSITGQHCPRKL